MKTKTFITGIIATLFLVTGLQAQYKIGESVQDFSLKNTDNKMVSLAQFNDARGFIVIFTCNTCPFARKYEKRIEQLDKDFRPKNYPVIAISSNDININPGDSFEEMQKRAKSEGYTFPYLYDETQEVARKFGATNTPHAFLLAREGDRLVLKYAGAIDNNVDDPSNADKKYIADAINAVSIGSDPAVSSTKAIGCGIKWKK